jgi:hypothetical protein
VQFPENISDATIALMPARVIYLILLMAVFLTGCSQAGAIPTIDSPTAIAAAVSTQMAGLPTATRTPTATPAPAIPAPSHTATPSPEPVVIPTEAAPSYITWTPSQCDFSAFIADLDIVDYSKVYPGASFTKTWRIKNIGTCTWTTQYRFQYISGTPMGADTIYLPRAVAPGETIDLSLQMKAPDIEEDYSNFWRLRNTAGEIFGTTFYVAIEVSKGTGGTTPTGTQNSAP